MDTQPAVQKLILVEMHEIPYAVRKLAETLQLLEKWIDQNAAPELVGVLHDRRLTLIPSKGWSRIGKTVKQANKKA